MSDTELKNPEKESADSPLEQMKQQLQDKMDLEKSKLKETLTGDIKPMPDPYSPINKLNAGVQKDKLGGGIVGGGIIGDGTVDVSSKEDKSHIERYKNDTTSESETIKETVERALEKVKADLKAIEDANDKANESLKKQ